MSLEHCYALIDKMESSLNDISFVYSEPTSELIDISPSTKIEIKNFLENANSILDFIAFHIFEKYSKFILDEDIYNNRADYVSFFYTKKKENFNKNMSSAFPNFKETNEEIYTIFESLQPWCAPNWRKNLHKLVNQNKHKNLSLQNKTDSYNVNRINIPGIIQGENIQNFVFENNTINGVKISNVSHLKREFGNNSVNYTRIFMFSDLKIPVVETLTDILDNEKKLLQKINSIKIQVHN